MPSLKEIARWETPTQASRRIGVSKQGILYRLDQGRTFRAVRTRAGWLIEPESVDRYAETVYQKRESRAKA